METGYVPGGGVTYLYMTKPEFVDKVMKHIEESVKAEMASSEDSDLHKPGNHFLLYLEEIEGEIELEKAGAKIVIDAMSAITRQIANNAGADGDKVVQRILSSGKEFGFGWNAKTNIYGDMIKQGVIDPTKVITSAIDHSTSVAGLLLTTEGIMVQKDQPKKAKENVNEFDE